MKCIDEDHPYRFRKGYNYRTKLFARRINIEKFKLNDKPGMYCVVFMYPYWDKGTMTKTFVYKN